MIKNKGYSDMRKVQQQLTAAGTQDGIICHILQRTVYHHEFYLIGGKKNVIQKTGN